MKSIFSLLATFLTIFVGMSSAFADAKISELTQKQQAIVPIASYTASGDIDKLKTAVNDGLNAGLTVNETKEIIVHLYAYCGFPRALNGLAAVNEVLQDRQSKGIADTVGAEAASAAADTDMLDLGTKVQTELAGAPVDVTALSPAADLFLKTHLFGDLFARGILSYEEREISTISALASMSGVQSQLAAHLRIGSNAGLSNAALQDIVNVLDRDVSSETADGAQKVLDEFLRSK